MSKPIHVKPSYYAYVFYDVKEIALKYGYNLVLHGSMGRDLDLIAIPWSPELTGTLADMLAEIAAFLGGKIEDGDPRPMYHGRRSCVINLNRQRRMIGEQGNQSISDDPLYYLDISITPLGTN